MDSPRTLEEKAKNPNHDHIESLRARVNRSLDVESLLSQAQALASLISGLAESPHVIEHDEIGHIGAFMGDHLTRLELAIALADEERADLAM